MYACGRSRVTHRRACGRLREAGAYAEKALLRRGPPLRMMLSLTHSSPLLSSARLSTHRRGAAMPSAAMPGAAMPGAATPPRGSSASVDAAHGMRFGKGRSSCLSPSRAPRASRRARHTQTARAMLVSDSVDRTSETSSGASESPSTSNDDASFGIVLRGCRLLDRRCTKS